MNRVNLFSLLFLVCLLTCLLPDVEAKSREKNKEKGSKKHYKTEGRPKEAKMKYSKNSQEAEEFSRKYKKPQSEYFESNQQEEESLENPKLQETSSKTFKQKKDKRPYSISVELVEEPAPEEKSTHDKKNINSDDSIEYNMPNELNQKTTKKQVYQRTKKVQTPKSYADDTADFIVHVPKNKKGKRQVLVFQVPAQDDESEQGEVENAVQQYVSEEQDAMVEEDCACEENAADGQSVQDKKSSNMCYY